MFGGGAKKAKSSGAGQPPNNMGGFGIDPTLLDPQAFAEQVGGAHAFDEDKLNQALSIIQDSEINLDNVHYTDEDLADPDLEQQLRGLGDDGGGGDHHHGDERAEDHMPVEVGDSNAPESAVDPEESRLAQEQLKRQRIEILKAQIQADKVQCIQLKKANDLEGARQLLLSIKAKQKRLDDMESVLESIEQTYEVEHPMPRRVAAPASSAARSSPSHPTTPTRIVAPVATQPSPTVTIKRAIDARMREYRLAIKEQQESGNEDGVQRLFNVFKHMQELLNVLNEGGLVTAADIPGPPPEDLSELPPPEAPPADDDMEEDVAEQGQAPLSASDGADEMKRLKIFATIDSLLVKQITEWHNRALKEKEAGRKVEAIALLKQKKAWMSDLEMLRLAQTTAARPPKYRVETIEQKHEVIHADLSAHEMEIEIIRLIDVKPPSLEDKTLDLSVACELPYPDQDKPQIFKTAVVKNSLSPEFQFKQRVRIERKKPFERFLKAKKVGFDILRAPTWFLGSAKSIGKAELKVSDLINQSEVYQTVDILEGRRATGGKLEARIRLRTPLDPNAKHYNITRQRLLFIEQHYVADPGAGAGTASSVISASELSASTPVVSPVKQQPSPTVVRSPSLASIEPRPQTPPVRQPTPETTPSSRTQQSSSRTSSPGPSPSIGTHPIEEESVMPQPVAAPSATVDPEPADTPTQPQPPTAPQFSTDPNSVDWLVSNGVLEWEQQRVNQQILGFKKAKKEVPFDIDLRATQIQMKMDLLVIQIQQGRLTMESYGDLLKGKIPEERQLALYLKQSGDMEGAKLALQRAKLMEQELAGE